MRWLFLILPFYVAPALAHGPIAEQAMVAVQKVTAQFLKEESKEIQAKFESVSSTLIGDERFLVKVQLRESASLQYECGLDTTIKPVKWGCKKK